jgi:hypothetical protein
MVMHAIAIPLVLATLAGSGHACSAPAAKTTFATASARVFRVPGGRTYACLYRVGRSVSLGTSYVGSGPSLDKLERIRLAGPYVAYVRFDYDHTFTTSRLAVRDLRTGRVVQRAGPLTSRVTDLELTQTGAAAWISDDGARSYEVWGPNGKRLDAGTDIDPRSLAVAGSTVYWTRGGRSFSAYLATA